MPTDATSIDPKVLLAACGGDEVILGKLSRLLQRQLPVELETANAMFQKGDLAALRESAHKLHGMITVALDVCRRARLAARRRFESRASGRSRRSPCEARPRGTPTVERDRSDYGEEPIRPTVGPRTRLTEHDCTLGENRRPSSAPRATNWKRRRHTRERRRAGLQARASTDIPTSHGENNTFGRT